MYTNDFLGMEFTEDGKGVVFHYLMGASIAEEYMLDDKKSATHFYMSCLRFFDSVEGCSAVEKEKMFRELLDSDFLQLGYKKTVY